MNIINGGMHADNSIDFAGIMVMLVARPACSTPPAGDFPYAQEKAASTAAVDPVGDEAKRFFAPNT
jgi:enolase